MNKERVIVQNSKNVLTLCIYFIISILLCVGSYIFVDKYQEDGLFYIAYISILISFVYTMYGLLFRMNFRHGFWCVFDTGFWLPMSMLIGAGFKLFI